VSYPDEDDLIGDVAEATLFIGNVADYTGTFDEVCMRLRDLPEAERAQAKITAKGMAYSADELESARPRDGA
jgi:hypothetical protein